MRQATTSGRPARRGSVLITTVIVTAVLAVVAAGMIRRGTTEIESASAKRNYDTSVSCADGARELLLSQFRAYGVDLTNLTLNLPIGDRRYATGHYDSFGVKSVEPVDRASVAASTENAMDLANRSMKVALGGAFYRVTVVCADSAGGRQSEVEFVLRFGL